MAELVLLFTMMLFVGFCASILGLGVYEVYLRKSGDQNNSVATTQTSNQDQNSCA